jgi:hypothetical protein
MVEGERGRVNRKGKAAADEQAAVVLIGASPVEMSARRPKLGITLILGHLGRKGMNETRIGRDREEWRFPSLTERYAPHPGISPKGGKQRR